MAWTRRRGHGWLAEWRSPDGKLRSKGGFETKKAARLYGAEAERKANPVVPGFLGEQKDRIKNLEVTITGIKYIDGAYGTTSLISMRTAEGKVAKWFASGYKEIEMGSKVTIDGTVKAQEVYNGQDQTILTRVKGI